MILNALNELVITLLYYYWTRIIIATKYINVIMFITIHLFLGFDVETLSHFGELHHSKSGDKFTKYSSLMKNEMFVKDVVEQSDIYDIYDVRLF